MTTFKICHAEKNVLPGVCRANRTLGPCHLSTKSHDDASYEVAASDRGRGNRLRSPPVGKSVTGVRARVDGKPQETVYADLVLDATGRGSSSAAWLEELGYQPPTNERVEIGIGYMTRR